MKKIFLKISVVTLILVITSCKSTSDTGNDNPSRPSEENKEQRGGEQQGKGKRPTVSEIFSQMDANKDGKLAESEVKGPIKNDFTSIDTNNDGYISKEELEKAPKPERGEQRR